MTPLLDLKPGDILRRNSDVGHNDVVYFEIKRRIVQGYDARSFVLDDWGERQYRSSYVISPNWSINYRKVVK